MSKKGFSVAATSQSISFYSVIVLIVFGSLVMNQAVAQNTARVVTKTGDELLKNIKEWHEPNYPTIARVARAGGPVEVELTVDEQGNVISARVISGHPLLQPMMLEAARAWKFNPMTSNGVAVRVIARVTYTFNISEPTFNDKTVSRLEREVRKKPKSAEGHYELGGAYFNALRYPEAIAQLTEAIRINPKHTEAHLKLGHAYARIHSFDRARAAYTQAVHLDPNRSEPLHALGLTYMHLGKYEEAISTLEKSLQVEGPITSSYFMIGKCYVLLDRPAEAVGPYKQGLAEYSDSDVGHYGLGEAYLNLGKFAEAISEFKTALKLSDGPGKSVTHYHLGLAYVRSGDQESALKEYEILKKLNEELANRLLEEIKRSRKDTT